MLFRCGPVQAIKTDLDDDAELLLVRGYLSLSQDQQPLHEDVLFIFAEDSESASCL